MLPGEIHRALARRGHRDASGTLHARDRLKLDLISISGQKQPTLTAANVDVFVATVATQGTANPNGLTLSTVESATITGGTGRFAGAKGSYVLERVIVHATGNSTGTFTGTIQLAK